VFRGLFSRFDHSNTSGFVRIVSIFINPNNAGLLFSLAFVYVYSYYDSPTFSRFILKAIFLLCIFLVIYLTGSKTPLVLLFLFLLASAFNQSNRSTRMLRKMIYAIISVFVLIVL